MLAVLLARYNIPVHASLPSALALAISYVNEVSERVKK
jgi:hypothetical protein